jgi:diguanylate cyclase (GGDEF)-like protein/PAS domain S-box-containing protein
MRNPPTFVHSLKTRLGSLKLRLALLTGLVIVACVAATSQVVLQRVELRSEQAVLDLEAGNAERMAMLVTNRVVQLQNTLNAGVSSLPSGALQGRSEAARALMDQPILASMFSTVVLARADGELLVRMDKTGVQHETRNVFDRDYFRRTVEQARPIVSPPTIGRLSNEPIVVLTHPIKDAAGAVQGVLLGSMRLASRNLMDDLTQANSLGRDAVVTFIADLDGRILSHPDPARVLKPMEEEPGMTEVARQWAEQGRPVEPTGDARHLGGYFVASAGVPQAEWVVFRVAADQALMGGVVAARAESLKVGSMVAVVGALGMLLLLWWTLRPLTRLHRQALRLGQGQSLVERDWPDVGGEIGALSVALREALQQREAQERVNGQLADRMRSILVASPVGIVFTRDGLIETASVEFARLFDHEPQELLGRTPRELYVSEADHATLVVQTLEAWRAGKPYFGEWPFRRRDGSTFWGRLQGKPVNTERPQDGTLWLMEDVTDRREARERLSWAASHDALTRLFNRDAFERQLDSALAASPRELPATVLFIDLDRFKAVNDTAGHAAGDAVLKEVAQLLRTHVRGSDVVARLGGDEFAILLPQCDGASATRIAEQIREGAQLIGVTHEGRRLSIGSSIGLVELDAAMAHATEVLKLADAACYEAKHAGRNAVRAARSPGLRVVAG